MRIYIIEPKITEKGKTNMITFAIDTGNKQIKTKHFTFISGIIEQDTVPAMVVPTEYFKYKGKYYVLSNRRDKYQRDKSESDQYFLLTLMGIVKELDKGMKEGTVEYQKDKVYSLHVLCGLPPAHMSDAVVKKNFKNYLKTPEPIKIIYCGKTWTIKVAKVSVYAQCYAAIMTEFARIKKHSNVLGIDIGGFTTDYLLLQKGCIDMDFTDSLENGVILFYNKVNKECRKKYNAIIKEMDVDDILSGNTEFYEKEIVNTVYEVAGRFIEQLLATFREEQIDLEHTFVVFMGGGSLLLRKFIEKSPLLKNYMFIDEVNANVAGYEFLYQVSQRKAERQV